MMTEAAQLEAESKRTQQVNKTGLKPVSKPVEQEVDFLKDVKKLCQKKPQAHIACEFF